MTPITQTSINFESKKSHNPPDTPINDPQTNLEVQVQNASVLQISHSTGKLHGLRQALMQRPSAAYAYFICVGRLQSRDSTFAFQFATMSLKRTEKVHERTRILINPSAQRDGTPWSDQYQTSDLLSITFLLSTIPGRRLSRSAEAQER